MMTNICIVEEGRKYPKEAQLIELEDALDSEVLASALVQNQISLFPGMLQATRDTVHTVALSLVQVKLDGFGDTATKRIVDRVVDRLTDVVKAATQAAVTEIKSASTALVESSTQFTTSQPQHLHDALTSKGSSS